jgi:RimJ/RimL family protein N-acetyltransferase
MFQGERVLLRAIERDDLPVLWAFNNSLAVELAGGGDPPMPQSLAHLQAEFESQASQGGRAGSSFAIEVDGRLIGQCALFAFDDVAQVCELGITIGDRDYWGKSFGREAVALLLAYAFRYRNMRRVYLKVHGRNERARRSYLACGFVEEGRLRVHVWSDGAYDDLVLMGLLRDEWLARQEPLAQHSEEAAGLEPGE